MSSSLNWGKLYDQGRCKDIGVSWTEEEAVAVAELTASGIPRSQAAALVRAKGPLTLDEANTAREEQQAEEDESGTVPLKRLKKDELLVLCKEYGVDFADEKAPTNATLMDLLQKAECPDRVPRPEVEE